MRSLILVLALACLGGSAVAQHRDELPNLTSILFEGWDWPLVPRDTDDATIADVHLTPFLPDSWIGPFWWNFALINNGGAETTTTFLIAIVPDDRWYPVVTDRVWVMLPPNNGRHWLNSGPYNMHGGRHTLEARIDWENDIEESDETDNNLAYQFVWTPHMLDGWNNYATPPKRTGGWDAIPAGEERYYNCAGVRFDNDHWWEAATTIAYDPTEDFDCRLHDPSTGSQDGFVTYHAWSGRPAGSLDAVIVNRNQVGRQEWDLGVLRIIGDGEENNQFNHWVAESETFPLGTTETISWEHYFPMLLREFYVEPTLTGYIHARVEIDLPEYPIHMIWLAEDFTVGTLTDADGYAMTDAEGVADLYLAIPEAGYHCLGIYRNGVAPQMEGSVDLTIEPGRPDFTPDWRDGWHAPCVPRPDTEGAPNLVEMPDTLYGDDPSTRYNVAMWNASPVPYEGSDPSLRLWIEYDAVPITWFYIETLGGYGAHLRNGVSYHTIPGGRHTYSMILDKDQHIAEANEDNNTYGEQYCWSPIEVPLGTAVTRSAPTDPVGGWETLQGPTAYNCDGLRVSGEDGWWNGLVVMPGDSCDLDVRLHEPLVGTQNGFDTYLAWSGTPGDRSDFVLVNFNQTAFQPYDMGIINFGGSLDYRAQAATSVYLASDPDDTFGPYTMSSGDLLQLYEFELPAGNFSFQLENLEGSVNWGLSLYPQDAAYHAKWATVPGGVSWDNLAGEDEHFAVAITEPGYYALAVWKVAHTDTWQDGTYQLTVGPDVSAIDDPITLPHVTTLVGVHPNPFRPHTTLTYELVAGGPAKLEIYDVLGRRVRTLMNRNQPAGRHEATWDGCDEAGRQVPSGTYLLRFSAGEIRVLRKVIRGL